MKIVMVAFAILAAAFPAGAASFTKDGQVGSGGYGYNYAGGDRWLIADGSFENGCGVNWTCAADNSCVWIADLVPLGLWNYDGSMVAWLGGFCGGIATCYSSVCQIILIDGDELSWYWMGYVNDTVAVNYVSVEGHTVYSHVLQLDEHLQDYQQERCDVGAYQGHVHEVCFGVDNEDYCGANLGDNWFVDYVEINGIPYWPDDPTGVSEMLSISTVKALY